VLDEESRREGGFAYVFRARENAPPGGPDFAVKVLFASPFLSADKARDRFLHEINALRTLQHKAVVRYVMAGVTADQYQAPFLVMDHIDGGTLRELSAEMSVDEKLEAVIDVLDVLAMLHSQGIFHRDVKPSNVMRRRQDRQAILVDFGLAWLARDQYDGPPLTTGPLGTPGYIPPEVEEGDYTKSRSPQFDIYSAATMLYELLAKRLPIANRRYRPLREVEADLAGLDPILEKALAPESQRFAAAHELRVELVKWRDRYRTRLASPRSPLLDQLRTTIIKTDAAKTLAAEREATIRRKVQDQLRELDTWLVDASKEACSEFVDCFHDLRPSLRYLDSQRSMGQAGFDALCAVLDDSIRDSVLHFARATPEEVRQRLLGSRTSTFLRWSPNREAKSDSRLEHRPLAEICWVLSSAQDGVRAGFGAAITHNGDLQLFARPLAFIDSTEPSRISSSAEAKGYVTQALSGYFLGIFVSTQ
jgi:serine/threonine protein kinase